MYRKVGYVFGAVAGSFAVVYGLKNQYLKDGYDEIQIIKAARAQNLRKDTENNENCILPLNLSSVSTAEYGKQKLSISQAIVKARDLAYRVKDEVGAPGLVIGVSINGKTVWAEGLGMADVENRVPCHPGTVMRIASISKSMTMAVVAKLWQDGKLDLDKPVQFYVPSFPKKTFNKEEVTISTRQLVSHLAGVRHYDKPPASNETNSKQMKDKKSEDASSVAAKKPDTSAVNCVLHKEFYIKDRFATVEDALKLFQDDNLMFKPGTSFLYSTHGWTLVSAVVEAAASEPFTEVMRKFFQVLGLKYTYLDEPEPLIYNRSRYYCKNARGRLNNVPYVDSSYKWAGGGLLSTVGDLLRFGNAMLYSYQWRSELDKLYPSGYLKAETVRALWTPQPGTTMKWGRCDGYGMGWVVVPSLQEHGGGDAQKFAVGHTGGAVGASSVLLVVPDTVPYPSASPSPVSSSPAALPAGGESTSYTSSAHNSLSVFSSSKPVVTHSSEICIPCGVTVAIIMNLQDVGLHHLALDVAALFCETQAPVS